MESVEAEDSAFDAAVAPDHRADDSDCHLVGLVMSHAEAPAHVREQLALDDAALVLLLAAARHGGNAVEGIAALSTCSRTELYAVVRSRDEGVATLRALLHAHTGAPHAVVGRARELHGAEVAHHVMRVAAGLESLMVGEHEILGQLRNALRRAATMRAPGPVLHRLLECAIATGARARNETRIGHGHTTLGFAAAATVSASLHGPGLSPYERHSHGAMNAGANGGRAVVIGAGRIAGQVALQLRRFGWKHIDITNRTVEHARELASRVGGTAHPLSHLGGLLSSATAVVGATSVTVPILTGELLRTARLGNGSPLVLVDLGNPRNVAPECARLPHVQLYDLDNMHGVLEDNRASRRGEIDAVERVVGEELERFLAWWRLRKLVPIARRLRESLLADARLEVERHTRQGSPANRAVLEQFSEALVNRILRRPFLHLRAIARDTPELVDHTLEPETLLRQAYLTTD